MDIQLDPFEKLEAKKTTNNDYKVGLTKRNLLIYLTCTVYLDLKPIVPKTRIYIQQNEFLIDQRKIAIAFEQEKVKTAR